MRAPVNILMAVLAVMIFITGCREERKSSSQGASTQQAQVTQPPASNTPPTTTGTTDPNPPVAPVPEPATLILTASGIAGLVGIHVRNRRKRNTKQAQDQDASR